MKVPDSIAKLNEFEMVAMIKSAMEEMLADGLAIVESIKFSPAQSDLLVIRLTNDQVFQLMIREMK